MNEAKNASAAKPSTTPESKPAAQPSAAEGKKENDAKTVPTPLPNGSNATSNPKLFVPVVDGAKVGFSYKELKKAVVDRTTWPMSIEPLES